MGPWQDKVVEQKTINLPTIKNQVHLPYFHRMLVHSVFLATLWFYFIPLLANVTLLVKIGGWALVVLTGGASIITILSGLIILTIPAFRKITIGF